MRTTPDPVKTRTIKAVTEVMRKKDKEHVNRIPSCSFIARESMRSHEVSSFYYKRF